MIIGHQNFPMSDEEVRNKIESTPEGCLVVSILDDDYECENYVNVTKEEALELVYYYNNPTDPKYDLDDLGNPLTEGLPYPTRVGAESFLFATNEIDDVEKYDFAIQRAYEMLVEMYYQEGTIESVPDVLDAIYVKTPADCPQGFTVSLGNKEMLDSHKRVSEEILAMLIDPKDLNIEDFRIWWNDCCNV